MATCSMRRGRSPTPQALVQDEIELVVQVNGKLRGSIRVPAGADRGTIEAAALSDAHVQKFVAGQPIKKTIIVPGKLVNVVVYERAQAAIPLEPPAPRRLRVPSAGPHAAARSARRDLRPGGGSADRLRAEPAQSAAGFRRAARRTRAEASGTVRIATDQVKRDILSVSARNHAARVRGGLHGPLFRPKAAARSCLPEQEVSLSRNYSFDERACWRRSTRSDAARIARPRPGRHRDAPPRQPLSHAAPELDRSPSWRRCSSATGSSSGCRSRRSHSRLLLG